MLFPDVGNKAKRYQDTMDLVYLCASFFDETCSRKCIEYLTNPAINDNELMTISKLLDRMSVHALSLMKRKNTIQEGRAPYSAIGRRLSTLQTKTKLSISNLFQDDHVKSNLASWCSSNDPWKNAIGNPLNK